MVKIYTKKGDDGTTGLWYGGRVVKSGLRTDAYGTLDEACSALGLARALCDDNQQELARDILALQNELFVAGAELATAPEAAERLEDGTSRITAEMVDALDPEIDKYMARVNLPPKFVIPGGTPLSAQLDVARTIVRRAERATVRIQLAGELASTEILRFLNRASDLVFSMARYADVDFPDLFEGRRKSGDPEE